MTARRGQGRGRRRNRFECDSTPGAAMRIDTSTELLLRPGAHCSAKRECRYARHAAVRAEHTALSNLPQSSSAVPALRVKRAFGAADCLGMPENAEPTSARESRRSELSPPLLVFLLTMAATVAADLGSKAIARAERPSALAFHAIAPSTMTWMCSVAALAAVIVATAVLPHRPPSWVYGGGIACGGAVANMAELATRGSVTNFIAIGDHVACPADVAIVLGVAWWWAGSIVGLARR